MNYDGKSRDDLARQANRVRTKLLRTVEQLDQRRHEAFDLKLQMKRHVRHLAVAGALLLVATAAGVALVVERVTTAAARRRRNRWRFAKRVWQHPERALRAERRSFFGEVVRGVLLATVTTALTIPARRAVAHLVEGKRPEPSGEPAH
jgi:hypothetical protein